MQILRKKYDVYGRLSLRLKTSDMWPLHTKITNTNLVCYSYNELMVEKKIPLLENTKKEISLYY